MKTFFLTFLLSFSLFGFSQNKDCRCCEDAHKAFDFWVGSWEVFDGEGKLVGKNKIVKKEDGCLLEEVYQSTTSAFTGRSYNFYNKATGNWEQLWVDNQGSYLKLSGNLVGGAMVMQGENLTGPEHRTERITWTLREEGKVRQLWEVKKGDSDWEVVFDGYYSKVADR